MNFRDYDLQEYSNILLIAGVIYLALCFTIAWVWGRKRRVGFLWSFVFSVLMTPLVGIAITLAGRKSSKDRI